MILLVGNNEGEGEQDWRPEIYDSATGTWKFTAPHPHKYGYEGELTERVYYTVVTATHRLFIIIFGV